MKVYDEKGLKVALQNLDAPPPARQRHRLGVRLRSAGVILSTTVALSAGLLHVASFVTDFDHVRPVILALALFSLGCFGAMLAASGVGQKTRELARRASFGGLLMSGVSENIAAAKKVPAAVIVGFVALAFYFGINFLSLIGSMSAGSPVERDGELQLQNHGHVVRTLDRAEFRHLETLEVRGMSGHFVMFSLAATIGFLYLVDKRGQDAS